MEYKEGLIEQIDIYRSFRIVIEHNLNIFEGIKNDDCSIYTICGTGRTFQGTTEEVMEYVDVLIDKYSD